MRLVGSSESSMIRLDLEGLGATSVLAELYCLIAGGSRMLFGGQPCMHMGGASRSGSHLGPSIVYMDVLQQ
jgi:hypothetical protein